MAPAAIYTEIGRRIRRFREKEGWSQAALGEAVSPSRVSIVNIERGRQRLPIHTLWAVAAALGIEVAELIPSVQGENSGAANSFRALDKSLRKIGGDRATKDEVEAFIGDVYSNQFSEKP